jgi:hypothetical protein
MAPGAVDVAFPAIPFLPLMHRYMVLAVAFIPYSLVAFGERLSRNLTASRGERLRHRHPVHQRGLYDQEALQVIQAIKPGALHASVAVDVSTAALHLSRTSFQRMRRVRPLEHPTGEPAGTC